MADQMQEQLTVLFVDDEENILRAARRTFADESFTVETSTSPRQALDLLSGREVAVVVSDNMMPEMRGTEFLTAIKRVAPGTVRILMTGYADLTTALQAINSGEVYRFIVKPWKEDELIGAVRDGVNRYRVLTGLQREDEAILKSLAQTIELKDPYTRGHCDRVATYALRIADCLGLDADQQKMIRFGSWLHDCGKIGVPEAILNAAGALSSQEFDTVRHHSEWGAEVARQASLPQEVVNIVRHHHERFDGSGYPSQLCGEAIPLEARIVAVADVFDALTTDRPYHRGLSSDEAVAILLNIKGSSLDPALVDIFVSSLPLTEPSGTRN